jgi:hypothetical protein
LYFELKGLLKCVLNAQRTSPCQFLACLDNLIAGINIFKSPPPGSIASKYAHLFNRFPFSRSMAEQELEIVLNCNRSSPREDNFSKNFTNSSSITFEQFGINSTRNFKNSLRMLLQDESTLSPDQVFFLTSINEETLLFVSSIRSALKDSDEFFTDQKLTPLPDERNISVLTGPDISSLCIHADTFLNGNQIDSKQQSSGNSKFTKSDGASKFKIETSSLVSTVRGNIALEFGSGNSISLLAELLLCSGIDADVPECCVARSLKTLHLNDKPPLKTLRFRNRGSSGTIALIIRLKF